MTNPMRQSSLFLNSGDTRWTDEQSEIFADKSRLIVVGAFAGTGKTTTCRGYTQQHPDERYLYIAFNKSAQLDARPKFPREVAVLTTHALAFPHTGRFYARPRGEPQKLGNITPIMVAQRFRCAYDVARDALTVLGAYLQSPNPEIEMPEDSHLERGSDELARRIWEVACKPEDLDIPMPHDGYLKLYFEAGAPGLNRFTKILFDEAQDANPLLLAILELAIERNARLGLMAVGDTYQSIYRFRGATNAMESELFAAVPRHYLTASWRFGSAIAEAANAVLQERGSPKRLRGLGPESTLVRGGRAEGAHCYLSRTNADALRYAMRALQEHKQPRPLKLAFCGGIERYRVERLIDGWLLYHGRTQEVRDTEFRKFQSFQALREYANEVDDMEIKMVCMVVEEFLPDLPDRIDEIRRHARNERGWDNDIESADVSLSTAHKAKGLEWDTVILGEFFEWGTYETEKRSDPGKYVEELNLLYVAATRARKVLHTNATLEAAMTKAGLRQAEASRAGAQSVSQAPSTAVL